MQLNRSSGVLTPLTSLPGPYGVGVLGDSARRFVDWLAEAQQTYWQILPVGPTGFGDSPYQSFSSYAGNPYFIDPQWLYEQGWLTAEDLQFATYPGSAGAVDYGWLWENRRELFHRALPRFLQNPPADFAAFCAEQSDWLTDYALFMACKDAHDGAPYLEWEEDLRARTPEAIARWQDTCAEGIRYYQMLQYCFDTQWTALKTYANRRGISIIGDIPIYVAADSADVWANPEAFSLDEEGYPTQVAGCPPDLFSEDGQLWGNPLYDWAALKQDGYRFWINRLAACLKRYDLVRIDHFRAFADYYCIPADAETAAEGEWAIGPGMDLFDAIRGALGDAPIIAEDLGSLSPLVDDLLEKSGLPGMKVLQFGFDPCADSAHLPHHHPKNAVVYTGTHDNDTVRGWFADNPAEAAYAKRYLHIPADADPVRPFMEAALASRGVLCVLTLQDILGLDTTARMNIPGTQEGNWLWRMPALPNEETTRWLAEATSVYRRCG